MLKEWNILKQKPDVFVSKENNPMDIFGIGSNMVKALRVGYRLLALVKNQIVESEHKIHLFRREKIFENDRYVEELSILFYCTMFASNKDEATAWYYFSIFFNQVEFNRDEFVEELE